MFGIFAGINVHSERLNSFKAGINKFNVIIRFQYYLFLRFLQENIRIYYNTMVTIIWENAKIR